MIELRRKNVKVREREILKQPPLKQRKRSKYMLLFLTCYLSLHFSLGEFAKGHEKKTATVNSYFRFPFDIILPEIPIKTWKALWNWNMLQVIQDEHMIRFMATPEILMCTSPGGILFSFDYNYCFIHDVIISIQHGCRHCNF